MKKWLLSTATLIILGLSLFLAGRACAPPSPGQVSLPPQVIIKEVPVVIKEKVYLKATETGERHDDRGRYTLSPSGDSLSVALTLAVENSMKFSPGGKSIVSTVRVFDVDNITGERLDEKARSRTIFTLPPPPRWSLTLGGFADGISKESLHPFVALNYRLTRHITTSVWSSDYGPAAGLFLTIPLRSNAPPPQPTSEMEEPLGDPQTPNRQP